jgi:antitoxin (DNA-binding transcriptional repressor) of toxin-antitoxin stability system
VVSRNYKFGVKTVGVRDLKTHLSSHLRDVERGDVILVTDRGRVVAELRPPGAAGPTLTPEALARYRLVERGLLRPAVAPGSLAWTAPLPRLLRTGTAQELLDADREDRA